MFKDIIMNLILISEWKYMNKEKINSVSDMNCFILLIIQNHEKTFV